MPADLKRVNVDEMLREISRRYSVGRGKAIVLGFVDLTAQEGNLFVKGEPKLIEETLMKLAQVAAESCAEVQREKIEVHRMHMQMMRDAKNKIN